MFEMPDQKKIVDEANAVHAETKNTVGKERLAEAQKRIFQSFFMAETSEQSPDARSTGNHVAMNQTLVESIDEILMLPAEGLDWYRVDRLDYTMGDAHFSLFDMIPAGYTLYVCPDAKPSGSVSLDAKTILLHGDVTSLGSLAILLHEVGHIRDYTNIMDKKIPGINPENYTKRERTPLEQLRSEREASLFALRQLWREIKKNPQTKDDVLLYLKNIAYYSYCSNALEKISSQRTRPTMTPMEFAEDDFEKMHGENDEDF